MPLDVDDLDPDIWDEHAARSYDQASAAMYAPEVLDPTLDLLVDQARGGPVLELAIGTGRIALPLAGRGLSVHGIEKSPAMVAELRRKPGGEQVPVTVGDMATTRAPGEFALVLLAYNGITNLLTQEQQLSCVQNAAAHLAPGGAFVVEVFVPPLRLLPPGERFLPFDVSSGHVGVDEIDPVHQLLVSHHYTVGEDRTFRSPHRYVWPAELDLMARVAGLTLTERWSDWGRQPFTADSRTHVSVWRRPDGA